MEQREKPIKIRIKRLCYIENMEVPMLHLPPLNYCDERKVELEFNNSNVGEREQVSVVV